VGAGACLQAVARRKRRAAAAGARPRVCRNPVEPGKLQSCCGMRASGRALAVADLLSRSVILQTVRRSEEAKNVTGGSAGHGANHVNGARSEDRRASRWG
jgi:hypothetical protein